MTEEQKDLLYKIAVSMTPGVSADIVRAMEARDVSAEEFICLESVDLSARLGLARGVTFQMVHREAALIRARQEMDYCGRHSIRPLFLSDPDYPYLLAEAPDAPVLIYVLGDGPLDSPHSVGVVGTRRCTPYGANFVHKFVEELGGLFRDLCVVSGLAAGIDSMAHQAALDAGVATVAVVAHGLHTIYPAANTELARNIVKSGGAIVTEYPSGTASFRNHFLARNRIIAGLSHISVVAESEIKGGAMNTANHANSYNREVGALPGRNSDRTSSGCNHLIRTHRASLVENANDIVDLMGWEICTQVKAVQRNLFPELDGDSTLIDDCMRMEQDPISVDALHYKTLLPVRRLMELLPELEFDGVVTRCPGNKYTLV